MRGGSLEVRHVRCIGGAAGPRPDGTLVRLNNLPTPPEFPNEVKAASRRVQPPTQA